jgi:phage recombination protein Bet
MSNGETAIEKKPRVQVPRWTRDQIDLLKRTVAKGLTDDEFRLFSYVCRRSALDPFLRQIYAIKRFDTHANDGQGGYVMAIQTGIDGYRLIGERSKSVAGIETPEFSLDPNEPGHPSVARVTIYKLVGGERFAFTGEARWSEFAQKHPKTKDLMGRWGDMPFNQLAKCAEAQAWRKGWPADLGMLLTHEEMPMIDYLDVQSDQPAVASLENGAPASGPLSWDAGTFYEGTVILCSVPKGKQPGKLGFRVEGKGECPPLGFWPDHASPEIKALKDPAALMEKVAQFTLTKTVSTKGVTFWNLDHFALKPQADEVTQPRAQAERTFAEQLNELYVSAKTLNTLHDLWLSSEDDRKKCTAEEQQQLRQRYMGLQEQFTGK